MRELLKGRKTHILMLLGVFSMAVQYMGGDITVKQFLASGDLQDMIQFVMGSTIRAGIAGRVISLR